MKALMGRTASVRISKTILAPAAERKAVGTVARVLQSRPGKARLVGPDGTHMVLPDSLFRALRSAAKALGAGHGITILPVESQLTTQQAADYLQVSRPFLISLLEKGQMPFHRVGTHRRVYLRDLIELKSKLEHQQRKALQELVDEAQDLRVYDE